jgi:NAD(P)-dependent dehydrogenase (short-subunit alcohol dehydrogenase family)
MQTTAGKTILITGANTGLGKEMARQLALRDDFERIYLGCRNPEKAERAKQDLEKVTGHKIFEVVIIDLEDLASVRAAVTAVGAPLNALAMIAGGIGGPTPASLTFAPVRRCAGLSPRRSPCARSVLLRCGPPPAACAAAVR